MMNYLTAAKKYEEELRAFKDDLHAHPEESFAEFRTTAKIRAAMEDLGAEIIDLGMETGVTAMLRGEKEGASCTSSPRPWPRPCPKAGP